jgi:hypothetical protein
VRPQTLSEALVISVGWEIEEAIFRCAPYIEELRHSVSRSGHLAQVNDQTVFLFSEGRVVRKPAIWSFGAQINYDRLSDQRSRINARLRLDTNMPVMTVQAVAALSMDGYDLLGKLFAYASVIFVKTHYSPP